MSLVNETPDVRYADKEFLTIREALQQVARNIWAGVDIDLGSANPLTVLIDMLAYLGEHMAFYQDAQAREAFFPTARLRESVLKHAALIGYQPQGRVAATCETTIEIQADSGYDIVIPADSLIGTPDRGAVYFRVLDDLTIPAGVSGTSIITYLENSLAFQESFTASGEAFAVYRTRQDEILLSGIQEDGSVDTEAFLVYVDGIPYTRVTSFLDANPTSTYFKVWLNNAGQAIIQFGDGVMGVKPAKGAPILVVGRTGGGSVGNLLRATQGPSVRNLNNEIIPVTFYNATLSSGGADEETLESIRIQAPLSLQANYRTVSAQDFITNAEGISGVDRAYPYTNDDDPAIDLNKTELVILTDSPTNAVLTGGNAAATSLTSGVNDDLGVSINSEDVQYVTLGTQASGAAIAQALQDAIRNLTPDFGLDNDEAYADLTVDYDSTNQRYIVSTGSASLAASISFSAGINDGSAVLKLTPATGAVLEIGAEPSAASQAAVLQEVTVTKPVCITHVVEVMGPEIQVVYVDARVRFDAQVTSDALKIEVRDQIRANLATFFSPRTENGVSNPEIDFGQTIRFSDLISVINETGGVESVDEDNFLLNGAADDVTVSIRAFPVLGGVTIRDEVGDKIE